jgi:hypothetical protein
MGLYNILKGISILWSLQDCIIQFFYSPGAYHIEASDWFPLTMMTFETVVEEQYLPISFPLSTFNGGTGISVDSNAIIGNNIVEHLIYENNGILTLEQDGVTGGPTN